MNRFHRVARGCRSLLILAAGVALLTSGCSATKYGAVNIDSSPTGAEIVNLKDNTNLGKTPAQVMFRGDTSEQVTVQLHKNGYHSAITTFWVNKRHSSEEDASKNAVSVHSELDKE